MLEFAFLFAATSSTDVSGLAVPVIVVLLGGGGLAAWATFRKAAPEAGEIATRSLINVNRELRTEINRLTDLTTAQRQEIDDQGKLLRTQRGEIEELARTILGLRSELSDVEGHIDEMKS